MSGISTLERAQPSDLVFVDSPKYSDHLAVTRGGVCLTTERIAEGAPASLCVLHTPNPFRDFVVVARKLYPDSLRPRSLFETEGVAEGAIRPSDRGDRGRRHHRSRRGDRAARGHRLRAP